jgi:hypothetical protein
MKLKVNFSSLLYNKCYVTFQKDLQLVEVTVFWVLTLYNDVVGYQHFRGHAVSIFRVKMELVSYITA